MVVASLASLGAQAAAAAAPTAAAAAAAASAKGTMPAGRMRPLRRADAAAIRLRGRPPLLARSLFVVLAVFAATGRADWWLLPLPRSPRSYLSAHAPCRKTFV